MFLPILGRFRVCKEGYEWAGTGSGKTSLAQKILERVGADRCLMIAQDSYYRDGSRLAPEARAFDERTGAWSDPSTALATAS